LTSDIKNGSKGVEVTRKVGRSRSFEVTVDGELIFSKLKSGGFPISDEVVAQINRIQGGSKPEQLTNTKSRGCAIM